MQCSKAIAGERPLQRERAAHRFAWGRARRGARVPSAFEVSTTPLHAPEQLTTSLIRVGLGPMPHTWLWPKDPAPCTSTILQPLLTAAATWRESSAESNTASSLSVPALGKAVQRTWGWALHLPRRLAQLPLSEHLHPGLVRDRGPADLDEHDPGRLEQLFRFLRQQGTGHA